MIVTRYEFASELSLRDEIHTLRWCSVEYEMLDGLATEVKRDIGKDFVRNFGLECEHVLCDDLDVCELFDIAPQCPQRGWFDLYCVDVFAASRQNAGDHAATCTEIIDDVVFADIAMSDELCDEPRAAQEMLRIRIDTCHRTIYTSIMTFNHYAKIKRILAEQEPGWVIVRVDEPTSAKNFKGEVRTFDHYYRIYAADGQPIKYCKFQQLDRLAGVLNLPIDALPVVA